MTPAPRIDPWPIVWGTALDVGRWLASRLAALAFVDLHMPEQAIRWFIVKHTTPSRLNPQEHYCPLGREPGPGLFWWGRVPVLLVEEKNEEIKDEATVVLRVPRPWAAEVREWVRTAVDWPGWRRPIWMFPEYNGKKRLPSVQRRKANIKHLALGDDLAALVDEATAWYAAQKRYETLGVPWSMGWLLHGQPGTGKTSLALAVAEHLNLTVVRPPLVGSVDVVESFKQWREMDLDYSSRPKMVLIEDIDRVYDGDRPIAAGTIPFDQVLDLFSSESDGLFFVVTCNSPEAVDPALGQPREGGGATRPGRLDRVVYVGPLSEASRRSVAARLLADWPELHEEIVQAGDGETAAQFQDRCVTIALRRLRTK